MRMQIAVFRARYVRNREGTKAIGASQQKRGNPTAIDSCTGSLHPRRLTWMVVRRPLQRLIHELTDGLDEFIRMALALRIESIGHNARRVALAQIVSAAHCDRRQRREPPPNDRQKFNPRHPGHMEIRDDQVRSSHAKFRERFQPVACGDHVESFFTENQRHYFPHGRIVIYKQNRRS